MQSIKGYQAAMDFTTQWRPQELAAGPHLFSDLRFIVAGKPSYWDADGVEVTLKPTEADGPLRPLRAHPLNVPFGVRVVAEKAGKSEPVEGPVAQTVMYDQGIYRGWNGANYCESEDGFHWTAPALPGEEGVTDRNELFFKETGGAGGPGVFIDPSAPAEERYKMVFLSHTGGARDSERYRNYFAARPNDVDPVLLMRGSIIGIYGAVSGDGIYWKPLPEPLVLNMADTNNTCYYDTLIKKYVLYSRCAGGHGRRCIGRAESDTFDSFPLLDLTVWADMEKHLADDLYTNAHSIYPGTVDQHFMFPAVYNRGTDDCHIDAHSSPDGIHWMRIPGGPIVTPSHDDLDDGCMFTRSGGLVPLAGDRVGLMVQTSTFPHRYPRWPDRGDMGLARYITWKTGRIACVQAEDHGFFATPVIKFTGRELRLNFQAPLTGEIRAEVVGIKSWVRKKIEEEPVPGRSFEDCDPMSGDKLAHTVTWRGQSDLGHAEDQPIYLRFKMRYAKLYGFEFV